ncbi:MAG: amino acid permease [Bacteroidales bacterium]|nr:amino acid permease [Bacteroidales bacterium]
MAVTTKKSFGTAPVFFTAIATILGAILFLRFGFAVGTLGFWGVIGVILLGHMVTIPTALAISEIATNKRVEGGGEYFIISRSFGMNIGATIGFALFISQAISVAFYIIAFTEAFEFLFNWVSSRFEFTLPRQVISIPAMIGLSILILKKGASVGMKTLYFVVAILLISLLLFFLGNTEYAATNTFSLTSVEKGDMSQFFLVFAIIFPAFTGMTAGVGLSGDLKKPGKSIPRGTILATVTGMIVYFFIIYKLTASASLDTLKDPSNQLAMADIALAGGFIIPLGLAASTFSSAIGSIIVAPRTLQALAGDASFPSKRINRFIQRGRGETNEPFNATLVTVVIAMVFVIIGDVNKIAGIISMFFMVTYGSLCLISFLHHFGSAPSYRPSFRSRWYISLVGFVASVWVMFKIDTLFAIAAIVIMVLLYLFINNYHKNRKGLVSIFTNALFQLNRSLQVYLQQTRKSRGNDEWRPSAICISRDSFRRDKAFQLLNWISYKYGFGTYIHLIEDYYSNSSSQKSSQELDKLVRNYKGKGSHVFVDTMISPSYTSAVAQAIQLPGISGMENNMVIFEFDRGEPGNLKEIVDNFALVNAGHFDVCIFGSSERTINYKNGVHVWIRSNDYENSHLMILLSYIIQGHPAWKRSEITIFDVCKKEEEEETRMKLEELVRTGRLPITSKNIQVISEMADRNTRGLINEHSAHAGLTIIGFHSELLKHDGAKIFQGYDEVGNILFVNAHSQKQIE